MKAKSISIVFTEYQLLQVESICYTNDFKKSDLIIADVERINHCLINRELFDDIYFLPKIYPNGSIKKLTRGYLKEYREIVVSKIDESYEYDILIGASDENTAMAIIKNYLKTNKYWSIEDGIGNYRRFGLIDNFKIGFKKFLFNYIYDKRVEILAQKGDGQRSKSFRIEPEFSVNKGEHVNIASNIKNYLTDNSDFYKSLINTGEDYKTVIVVDKEVNNRSILKNYSSRALVKKHPKHLDGEDKFSVQNMPIEVLPIVFKDIEHIIYDSYFCSSILNVLSLFGDINILLAFNIEERYKDKSMLKFIHEIKEKYNDRIYTI